MSADKMDFSTGDGRLVPKAASLCWEKLLMTMLIMGYGRSRIEDGNNCKTSDERLVGDD